MSKETKESKDFDVSFHNKKWLKKLSETFDGNTMISCVAFNGRNVYSIVQNQSKLANLFNFVNIDKQGEEHNKDVTELKQHLKHFIFESIPSIANAITTDDEVRLAFKKLIELINKYEQDKGK